MFIYKTVNILFLTNLRKFISLVLELHVSFSLIGLRQNNQNLKMNLNHLKDLHKLTMVLM